MKSYRLDLEDGKYTIINDNGALTFLRHGEAWPAADDLKHTGVVLALVNHIEATQALTSTTKQAADLWRRFCSLGRIRVVGSGGLGKTGQQHLGIEVWDKHPENDASGLQALLELLAAAEPQMQIEEDIVVPVRVVQAWAAERTECYATIRQLRQKLAEAGVEGSPPPGSVGTIQQLQGQLIAARQVITERLNKVQKEIELCSLGDRPQSPGMATLELERVLTDALAALESAPAPKIALDQLSVDALRKLRGGVLEYGALSFDMVVRVIDHALSLHDQLDSIRSNLEDLKRFTAIVDEEG